ncbi:hypothetical protein [Actinoplanes sichuanensis]|uniref:Uncharacterized protein n=1 Tax=Actinoplanes sichuanensis TaxID=512349 RepID=A0ABW4AQK9_9ACTN|nr:hypothetical protein [Actinoplanes sichuanensis]
MAPLPVLFSVFSSGLVVAAVAVKTSGPSGVPGPATSRSRSRL